MKTEIMITVRAYPVQIRDERTGEKKDDTIVLTKQKIQAVATIGMSDRDLINRLYNRQGYYVLKVGKPEKKEIIVDLLELYEGQEAGACDPE